MIQPLRFIRLAKNEATITKIYENSKLIRTYTKLVSYKEQKKSTRFLALTI